MYRCPHCDYGSKIERLICPKCKKLIPSLGEALKGPLIQIKSETVGRWRHQ